MKTRFLGPFKNRNGEEGVIPRAEELTQQDWDCDPLQGLLAGLAFGCCLGTWVSGGFLLFPDERGSLSLNGANTVG